MKNTKNNPKPSEADNEQNDDTNRQTVMTTETNRNLCCSPNQISA